MRLDPVILIPATRASASASHWLSVMEPMTSSMWSATWLSLRNRYVAALPGAGRSLREPKCLAGNRVLVVMITPFAHVRAGSWGILKVPQ
jgi:hypothetical protein